MSSAGGYRLFRGIRTDGDEAITRLIEPENRSIYHEHEDFTPPPAHERFDRDRVVATLAGYRPTAAPRRGGYDLKATAVDAPERLPSAADVNPRSDGHLSARLEPEGPLTGLRATAAASVTGEPVSLTARLAVTERGETTVDRPSPAVTYEWFERLSNRSPVPASALEGLPAVTDGTGEDSTGMGEPPGAGGY